MSDGSDCRIFLAVLQGEVSEEIWADQAALLDEILVEVRDEPLAHQASPTPLPPSRSPPRLSLPQVRKEPRLKGPMYATSALAKEAAKEESRKVRHGT
jgi:hypothetical protein